MNRIEKFARAGIAAQEAVDRLALLEPYRKRRIRILLARLPDDTPEIAALFDLAYDGWPADIDMETALAVAAELETTSKTVGDLIDGWRPKSAERRNLMSEQERVFTSGPWFAAIHDASESHEHTGHPDGAPQFAVIRAIDSIAGMRNFGDYGTEEFAANAKLIAAAPDLYDALVDARDDLKVARDDAFGIAQLNGQIKADCEYVAHLDATLARIDAALELGIRGRHP